MKTTLPGQMFIKNAYKKFRKKLTSRLTAVINHLQKGIGDLHIGRSFPAL